MQPRQTDPVDQLDRENFNLDSTHQAGQVRNKERNTGEHREPQADTISAPLHSASAKVGAKGAEYFSCVLYYSRAVQLCVIL